MANELSTSFPNLVNFGSVTLEITTEECVIFAANWHIGVPKYRLQDRHFDLAD